MRAALWHGLGRLGQDAPPLVAALAIAEAFFKFHSFTLETLAFLATWRVLMVGYAPIAERVRMFARGHTLEQGFHA